MEPRVWELLHGLAEYEKITDAITDNIALEAPEPPLPLPGLHVAEIVARQAKADGRHRVGLLGTKWAR